MKKRILAIIGYTFGVLWNIPHIVSTYTTVDDITNLPFWYIVGMVGVIDFTILVLAINENKETRLGFAPAFIFAWIVFILNLYLYWMGPIQSGIFSDLNFYNIFTLFIKLVFAAIPAYIIYYYSEMIADQYQYIMKDKKEINTELVDRLRFHIGNFSLEIENDREVIDTYRDCLESVMEIKGKKISVEGVKSQVCNCGRIVRAGSNKEETRRCECGYLIEW